MMIEEDVSLFVCNKSINVINELELFNEDVSNFENEIKTLVKKHI